MIEVTKYQCEICGAMFDESAPCEECEESHVSVDSVLKYLYYPKSTGPESNYPYSVVIKMADGKELTFKR